MPVVIPTDPYRYATVSDLVKRFGETEVIQLSDPKDGESIVDAVCTTALEDAAAEIDIYLMGRYTLPLPTVPRLLVNICCDLARAAMMPDRLTEAVKDRLTNARSLLGSLRDGKTTLGLDVAMTPVATTGGAFTTGSPRVFTSQSLGDYSGDCSGDSNGC